MATITFSDGQTTDASRIAKATLFSVSERLLVEIRGGDPVKISGPAVFADAEMLNNVRDEGKLPFLVFEKGA
jgi:hypothetical protein